MPQEHSRTSEENSRKLDHLIGLVEGQQDAPGILAKIALMEEVLYGKHGREGIVSKVNFLWRFHLWILCALSTVLGSMLTLLVQKVIKMI